MVNVSGELRRKALIAVLGISLLALALPRAVRFFWQLQIQANVETEYPTPTETREKQSHGAQSLRQIDLIFNDPQARIRSGMLELKLALSTQNQSSQIAHEHLALAIEDLSDGLSRSPANAQAWLELAHAKLASGDAPGALTALNASIEVGRYDPALCLRRTEIGLRLWLILTDQDRTVIGEQIQFAWNREPEELAKLAARDDWIANILRSALTENASALNIFDKMLAQLQRVTVLAK